MVVLVVVLLVVLVLVLVMAAVVMVSSHSAPLRRVSDHVLVCPSLSHDRRCSRSTPALRRLRVRWLKQSLTQASIRR